MTFTIFLAKLLVCITVFQLGAHAAVPKGNGTNGKSTTKGKASKATSMTPTIRTAKHSPTYNACSGKHARSEDPCSAKNNGQTTTKGTTTSKKTSMTPSPTSTTTVNPSPTYRACSIKRARNDDPCYIQDDVPWYLQWISLQNVDTFPWRNREKYQEEMSGWDFKWTIDLSWGEDVIIYVLDSGVDATHGAFFEDQVEVGESVSKFKGHIWESAQRDTGGHGTGVASLIVGQRNGIAHEGHIYPIKIIHGHIPGTIDETTEGILLAVENWKKRSKNSKDLRAVINISVEPNHSAEGQAALELAIEAGMHVVMSAGNDGINGCYDTPGVTDDRRLLRNVGQITVSGTTPKVIGGKFEEAFHKYNHGSCVDISAPSAHLFIARIGDNDHTYIEKSGSSFAAPLVSGVIASLLSSHSNYRNLKPAAFKKKFLKEYSRDGLRDLPSGTPDRRLVITEMFN